jgi:flagellar motor switch protein FliG
MANEQPNKAAAKPAKRPGEATHGDAARSEDPRNEATKAAGGALKAALWVLSAEEELAVDTLANLEESEIRRLHDVVQRIADTTPEQLDAVHQEFRAQLKPGAVHLRGSQTYLARLATRALGEEKATRLLTAPAPKPETQTSGLERADLELLIPVLAQEHPQVIAAVIASLELERSTEILRALPEGIRPEVVRRMAHIMKVPRGALNEVERVLSAGLPTTADDDTEVDGVRKAALILNQLEGPMADGILSGLRSDDLAGELRRAMFTFDDLSSLDKKALQMLLKETPSEQLLTALKTASSKMREQVFTSLSKRAAEMLKDDLEVMGPVRLSDVEQAQQAIVDIALRLRTEGKLTIGGSGGEELV